MDLTGRFQLKKRQQLREASDAGFKLPEIALCFLSFETHEDKLLIKNENSLQMMIEHQVHLWFLV